jgi:hypothetical protein
MNSPLELLKNAYQPIFQGMKIILVTKGEIINIISSLKSKKSPGYDGISSEILKLSSVFISGRSVGIVRLRTKGHGVKCLYKCAPFLHL